MQGFWNNRQATAERMVDGWVKTGDIGRLDANGYVYTCSTAPTVVEVAVFGIPDPKWARRLRGGA